MDKNPMELIIKDVRLSFPTLSDPEYFGGAKTKPSDKRRWSGTFLVPKGSDTDKAVEAKILECAQEKWKDKAATVLKAVRTDPKACAYVDGERKDYEGYQGMMALTAHRNEDAGRPKILDSDKSPIYQDNGEMYEGKAGRVYSGCYVDAKIKFWAQSNENGKAVRAELMVVMRRRDGDAFSGAAPIRDSAADDMDDLSEGADADDLAG